MLRPDFKTNFVRWQVFSLVVQYLWKCEQASCFLTFNFVPIWLCPSHFWRHERTAIRVPVEKLPLSSYPQGRQDLCVKRSRCRTSSWETHRGKSSRRLIVLFLWNSVESSFSFSFPLTEFRTIKSHCTSLYGEKQPIRMLDPIPGPWVNRLEPRHQFLRVPMWFWSASMVENPALRNGC